MKPLKKTIRRYMLQITGTLMIVILAVVMYLQVLVERYREYNSSLGVLAQIEQFIAGNVVEKDTTEALGKSEYSNLFSLIRVNSDANFYVVSEANGEILSSTDKEVLGVFCDDIGLSLKKIISGKYGFFDRINGDSFFCVFQKIGDEYVGRCVSCSKMFQRVPTTVTLLVLCLIVISYILIQKVSRYMNRYVVDGIHQINDELSRIIEGHMDVKIDIRNSEEFSELSDFINTMVSSLSDTTSKISYVLSKTNMFIGVYEYRKGAKPVHCTEYIPRIFSMELDEWRLLTSDYELFNQYIERVRTNPLEEEQGVYVLSEIPEQYVKLEEMEIGNEVFGVVIDVTEEVLKRRKLAAERDVDLLTGLYNRRGLEIQLAGLFEEKEKLGYSALVMIDADGLKGINDTYGHEMGDEYLKKIGSMIQNFGIRSSLASRQGGDEFVLFLYDYEDEEGLRHALETLEYIQENNTARLDANLTVPLRFSFGYCVLENGMSYDEMIKVADTRMYENKRKRKKALSEER